MAKRVYLAETDGTQFSSKAEAEAHDEEVRKEERSAAFQEKLALFISETDYQPSQTEEGAEAVSSMLETIRDNPLAFMEVMEVLLPKQWARKLKARRGDSAKSAKKKTTTKKKSTSKKKTAPAKKAGKPKSKKEDPKPEPDPVEQPEEPTDPPPAFDPNPENVAFPEDGTPTPEKEPEETPPPPPEEEAPPAPPEETPPPPPEEEAQGELTPVPSDDDIGDGSWRDDDDSPIPPAD